MADDCASGRASLRAATPTYGTDRTTNNKENQILVKLLEQGFVDEDRGRRPRV
jgi:hypothetical protein